jgi:hypothetical protein
LYTGSKTWKRVEPFLVHRVSQASFTKQHLTFQIIKNFFSVWKNLFCILITYISGPCVAIQDILLFSKIGTYCTSRLFSKLSNTFTFLHAKESPENCYLDCSGLADKRFPISGLACLVICISRLIETSHITWKWWKKKNLVLTFAK